MTKINLSALSISQTRKLLRAGDISCRELTEIYHSQIKEKDGEIGAYLEVFDDAYEEAEKQDEIIKRGGEPKPLAGLALAVKDNILIKGKHTTAASKILKSYRASYDASVIKKLREAGAVFLGRTNMDEFAMGSSCENSAYGATKNPYDTARVPGGSSGGSAAAVAAQMCQAALGSDTGGSIREPASFCGVVGLKPTYGTVSRNGLIAMASSLDQIGPLTKSVDDTRALFGVMKGEDGMDSTSVEYRPLKGRENPVVGVPKEFFSLSAKNEGVDEDVDLIAKDALEALKSSGCEIKEVSLSHAEYALACYYIIMPAEVSSNMARFDGIRYGEQKYGDDLFEVYVKSRGEGLGAEVRRRIILGTYVLSAGYYDAYYDRAQKARWLIKKDFQKAFEEVDALLTPTVATPAFKLGEKTADPLSMYMSDIFTVPANLAGVPSISVPFGTAEREGKKLPVGMQLTAPWFAEEALFNLGEKLEQYRS